MRFLAAIQADYTKIRTRPQQIGHLAEALELIVKKMQLLESPELSQQAKDVLQVFLGDVSAIRQIKASLPDARPARPRSVLGRRGGLGRSIETTLGLPLFHAALQAAQIVPARHAQCETGLGRE